MAAAQKKKRKKGKLFNLSLYAAFWLSLSTLLVLFFLVVIGKQITQYNQYAKQANEIQQKIDTEERTGSTLDAEMQRDNIDEHIEKVAREQLGLVKPDEILFLLD